MPRTLPAPGKAHVVVSGKARFRAESCGEMSELRFYTLLMLSNISEERFAKVKPAIDAALKES